MLAHVLGIGCRSTFRGLRDVGMVKKYFFNLQVVLGLAFLKGIITGEFTQIDMGLLAKV